VTEKYDWINITQKVEEETDIKITSIQDMMKGCEEGKTVFAVLGLDKNSIIVGKNISKLQEDMLNKISADDISTEIDNVDFSFEILDDNTKNTLTTEKDKLSFDYATEATKLDAANTDIENLDDLITALDAIKTQAGASASTKADVGTCSTRMTVLKDTTDPQITLIKSDLKTTMLTMPDITDNAKGGIDSLISHSTDLTTNLFTSGYVKKVIKDKVIAGVEGAKTNVVKFIDYVFDQLKRTVGSCQPLYAVYATALNYTCDGVFIHFSLMWASLSLIGISLLLYMCVARCLARYFIKFPYMHPADDTLSTTNIIKNDCGTTVTKF